VPAVLGVPLITPDELTANPGGRVPPLEYDSVAVDEVSLALALTGAMAVPDTLDWVPGFVSVTVLVTVHVNGADPA
jgi:hypothetical protein